MLFIVILAAAAGATYSCTTTDGRRLSRDRPIEECANVTQTVRHANGVVERLPSEKERAAIEAAEIRDAATRQQAMRDGLANATLLSRFPNEAAHAKHRADELAQNKVAIRTIETRLAQLEAERQDIAKELEFFPPGHPAPQALLRRASTNEALMIAQGQSLANQEREVLRINARLDGELVRLRTLWGQNPKHLPTARASSAP